MKLGVKSLCAIGALLLCSESVLAKNYVFMPDNNHGGVLRKVSTKGKTDKNSVTVYVSDYHPYDCATIHIKGEIRETALLQLSNIVKNLKDAMFSITISDNKKLTQFSPEWNDFLKQFSNLEHFNVLDCSLTKFPIKVLDDLPKLNAIAFWGNPIQEEALEDSSELLCYGNLRYVNGRGKACGYTRFGVNMRRNEEIDRVNKKIQDIQQIIQYKDVKVQQIAWEIDRIDKDLQDKEALLQQRKEEIDRIDKNIQDKEAKLKFMGASVDRLEGFGSKRSVSDSDKEAQKEGERLIFQRNKKFNESLDSLMAHCYKLAKVWKKERVQKQSEETQKLREEAQKQSEEALELREESQKQGEEIHKLNESLKSLVWEKEKAQEEAQKLDESLKSLEVYLDKLNKAQQKSEEIAKAKGWQ